MLTTMKHNGVSHKLIAEKIGCSESTIFNYCKKMGLEKGVNQTVKDHVRSLNEIDARQIIIPEIKDKDGVTVFERQPLLQYLEHVDFFASDTAEDVDALKRKLNDENGNDEVISYVCPSCNHTLYPLYICPYEGKSVFLFNLPNKNLNALSSNERENTKKFMIMSPEALLKYSNIPKLVR
jgi:hypothetical protein